MHFASLGGAERQGLGMSKILVEDYNCEVYLLLTASSEIKDDFKIFAKECHIRGIFHTRAPYLICWNELSWRNFKRVVWSFKYIMEYRKILKPYEFDYIFPFLNFPSKVAFYLYKVLPTVKFTFWHQLGLDVFKNDLLEKVAARFVPAVIANSPTGLEMFREYFTLKESKAYILPQYLTMNYKHYSKGQLREEFKISKNAVVYGMVAHYRDDKKHELILEVFSDLIKLKQDVHLVFAGNRESSDATKIKFDRINDIIISKGLEKNITLISEVAIEKVLTMLDVGLLISKIEGMPNAVMEYMLYELPVIASNHLGCVNLLRDSDFLIRNERKTLLTKMISLYDSVELREQEGLKNRTIIKNFTKEKYMKGLADIMEKYV